MQQQRTIKVADFEFTFACEVDSAAPVQIDLHVENVGSSPDTYLIRSVVKAESGENFILKQVSVSWIVPVVDMHGLYFGGNPGTELSRLPFWEYRKQTCANTGLPYIALIHRNGKNRAAFGLLDQLTETSLEALLPEQTRCYQFRIQKPLTKPEVSGGLRVSGQWEDSLFVSTAQQPWPEVLKQYAQVVEQTAEPPMPVPAHAYDPVFCSWTAIHHDVSHDWIMRNATVAAQLGFKTWITDDGWFIPEGRFADYSRTGDWEPCEAKFPNFHDHVKAVQALGMHYVLWLSPFMIGKSSKAATRYSHLLTKGQERLNFNNLAPWLKESQTIIANLYERIVRDYDVDGLKIDFIDSFPLAELSQDGVSESSIGQSIYASLKCATERILAIKPNFLIEYRNSYTNLASRAHGNLYRSSDVPINPLMNRWQAVMLRLLTPDRAIHLDPALWHENDTDENVAVHLINCIVSVPMVSIELDRYPQSHLDLIRYWIGFYNEHRETIIHGDFKPDLRQGHIPAILFEGRSESIISLYEDIPVTLDSKKAKLWLLNASTRPYVEFAPDVPNANYEATFRDKFGKVISKQQLILPGARLPIEIGGSAELVAQ